MRVTGSLQRSRGGEVQPREIEPRSEGFVDTVDIVVLAIEGVTVGLLFFLLYLLRSVYVLVRRDQVRLSDTSEDDRGDTG